MNSKVNPTLVKKNIHVAIAVIYHNDVYLLGYRSSNQHQGERYEFVGGKIEAKETPLHALIREVAEEIGIEIIPNLCTKMGKIYHEYPEVNVCLHTFAVSLTDEQYAILRHKKTGEIGQPLVWVDKVDLVSEKYPLPEANSRILSWLR